MNINFINVKLSLSFSYQWKRGDFYLTGETIKLCEGIKLNIRKSNLIISLINLLLIICVIIYLVIFNNINKDASYIFKENINSIVEVKASTENVGESFGTGVIYDSYEDINCDGSIYYTDDHYNTFKKIK